MGTGASDSVVRHTVHDEVLIRSGCSDDRPEPEVLKTLSAGERERFQSFRDPLRAAHFAGAHAEARRFLAGILGCHPARLRFGRHPCAGCGGAGHGRPYLSRPRTRWEFSLSRSGPYWVCAAAEGVRVGVDLERVRPMDLSRLPSAILSSGERRHLYGVPGEFRAAEFIRCWTRKEAVVKASGIGIEAALGDIDVGPAQTRPRVTHKAPGCEFDTWWVSDLNTRSGLCSALAVPSSADRSSQEDCPC